MSGQLHSTMNKLDLLRLMYLSREGDRREGVLLRQSKGWFQVAGMGHEAMAVMALLMDDGDYLFPYYRDRAMVLARGVSNFDLALAYFAKRESSSGGRQMPGHYSIREKNIWSVPTPTGDELASGLRCGLGNSDGWGLAAGRGHDRRRCFSAGRILRSSGFCRRAATSDRFHCRRQRLRHQHQHRQVQSVQSEVVRRIDGSRASQRSSSGRRIRGVPTGV